MRIRYFSRKTRTLIMSVAFLSVTVLSLLSPLLVQLTSAVSAGASNINLFQRGTQVTYNPSNGTRVFAGSPPGYATCKGRFYNQLKTTDFLKRHFSGDVDQIRGYPNKPADNDIRDWLSTHRDTVVNGLRENGDVAKIQYLLSGVGSAFMPVIEFYPTDSGENPVNSSKPPVTGPASACGDIKAMPVSQTEWRGYQYLQISATGGAAPTYNYLTFTISSPLGPVSDYAGTNATGTMQYHFYDGPGTSVTAQTANNFVLDGSPDFGRSGGVSTGSITAAWVNATTISIPDTSFNGLFGGDTYVKSQWGGDSANKINNNTYAYYFLTAAGSESRAELVGKNKCGYPMPVDVSCNGGAPNCVPFIAIQQNLDVNQEDQGANMNRLRTDINQLQTASGTLYTYSTDCRLSATLTITSYSDRQNAFVWFAYSKTANSFRNIWTNAATNESNYIGTYGPIAGLYKGGPNSCNGSIRSPTPPAGNAPFDIEWSFYDTSCQTLYGTITVKAIGGDAGEAVFNGAEPTPTTNINGAAAPRISCDFFTLNPLNWIVCPFIKAASSLVDLLDGAINKLLEVDTNAIFGDASPQGRAYHQAWGIFRTLALALIAIAALVMVIAQAAGLEFLDAYTIRKVLPRLLAAAVLITISWPLMEVLIKAGNDIGLGVRDIIYAPFTNFTQKLTDLSNGTKFTTLLLGTGAAIAFGWVALLSFLLTALLASLIAIVLLIFREIMIIFLVIIAPIGIACMILPNTQKGWKLWRDTFVGLLLVFIFISAFIALGRVFSVVAASSQDFIGQIIAIIAYFAPYFLIPLAFRLAGGLVATVGGIVNDRSRGMFDRLRKFRSDQPGKRYHNFKEGKFGDQGFLFNARRKGPLGWLANKTNTAGRRWDLGPRGKFGFGAGGQAAENLHAMSRIGETLRNPHMQALGQDDDATAAMAFGGMNERTLEQATRQLFTDRNGVYDQARATRAKNMVRAAGFGMDNVLAAQQLGAQNKWRSVGAGRIDIVEDGLARTIGENQQLLESARQGMQWQARSNGGRLDLGGVYNEGVTDTTKQWSRPFEERMAWLAENSTDAAVRERYSDPAERQRLALAYGSIVDAVGRTGVQQLANAHPHTITALTEALQFMDENGGDMKVTVPTTNLSGQKTGERAVDVRAKAAGILFETQRNVAASSGDTADLINEAGRQIYGIDYGKSDIGGQIARRLVAGVSREPRVIQARTAADLAVEALRGNPNDAALQQAVARAQEAYNEIFTQARQAASAEMEREANRLRNTARSWGGDVPESQRGQAAAQDAANAANTGDPTKK